MAARIERTANTNDTATLSSAIVVGGATSVTLLSANATRVYIAISTDKDIWIKLQAASADNDKKGVFLAKGLLYELPTDNIYTGEISAIAAGGAANVFTTEY